MRSSTSIVAAFFFVCLFGLPAFASPMPDYAAADADVCVTDDGTLVADAPLAADAPDVPDAPLVPDGTPVTGGTPVADIDAADGTLGTANVRNYCDFPVYLQVCGQDLFDGVKPCDPIYTLAAGTGTYSEPYSSIINDGRSIMLSPEDGYHDKPLLQFEYTNKGDGRTNSDISEVDGNPFGSQGFTLDSSNPACSRGWCAPPATFCPDVYTTWDNGVPRDCPLGDDIGISLCKNTYTA
ncbi:hypothetical protein IMSHALPRED_009149 [Imshaugia aleurites]|uniref:Uncharacterized protein n=1 Tax=Imshaugia aleurites TaxID=172621 RepID=A0A8H3ERY2_9LECA|nr:hypothetical protein IMSHALPRED_009149 [Imshaugia aleurites]